MDAKLCDILLQVKTLEMEIKNTRISIHKQLFTSLDLVVNNNYKVDFIY